LFRGRIKVTSTIAVALHSPLNVSEAKAWLSQGLVPKDRQ